MSFRRVFLNGVRLSKRLKSHARDVSRQSKVSLRIEVLDGGVSRARSPR